MNSKNENVKFRVDLSAVSRAIEIVVSHLRTLHGDSIEITNDFYWDIPEDDVYDVTKDPAELTVGQLSHDWERISAILEGKNEPIGYALVWLGAIFKAIGHTHIH